MKNGQKIPLKGQSAKVLEFLLSRPGRLITRGELIAEIWPDRTVEFDLGLNSCIRDIRNALSDNAKRPIFVETLAKRGYRFIGTVTLVQANSGARIKGKFSKAAIGLGLGLGLLFAAVHLVNPILFETPKSPFQKETSHNPEARNLMLAGVSALYDGNVPKTAEALSFFEKAVSVDPNFIEAYLMIARTIFARGEPGDSKKALAALEKILEMDPENVEALSVMSGIQWALQYDFEGAKNTQERLLEINPQQNRAYIGLSGYYLLSGDLDKSLEKARQALTLDPIQVTQAGTMGWLYFLSGRYRDALEFCLETQKVKPDEANTYRCFVNNHLALGETEAAAKNALAFLSLSGINREDLARLKTATALEILRYMNVFDAGATPEGRFDARRIYQAMALVRLKDYQKALEVLEFAYQERNYYLPYVVAIPEMKPLLSKTGFSRLVKNLNLPSPALNS